MADLKKKILVYLAEDDRGRSRLRGLRVTCLFLSLEKGRVSSVRGFVGFEAADKTKTFRLLLFSNEGKAIAALQTVQL